MANSTMRDCKSIQPLLSEYADGALEGETAWAVKMHCASCAVCDRIARDFAATANLLRTLPDEEPSVSFESKLAARLADITLVPSRPTLRERSWEWLQAVWARPNIRPAFAAGAALATVLPVSVVMLSRTRTIPATPVTVSSMPSVSDKESAAIRDLWQDHAAYSAAEPLGDPASVIASGTGL